jgi:hypothetical protein
MTDVANLALAAELKGNFTQGFSEAIGSAVRENIATIQRALAEQRREFRAELERWVEQMKQRAETQVNDDDLLTISAVAKRACVSEKFVRREIQSGNLLCTKLGGKLRPSIRISMRDYRAWVEQGRDHRGASRGSRQTLVEKHFGKRGLK